MKGLGTAAAIVVGAGIIGGVIIYGMNSEDVKKIKLIVDIGASISAIAAISITIRTLYWSMKKPLTVKGLVVFKKDKTKSSYQLGLKNIKDYPVTIEKIDGYLDRIYIVDIKDEQLPEYSSGWPVRKEVFTYEDKTKIDANGYKLIKIEGKRVEDIKKMYVLMQTSHGLHKFKCKKIQIIDVGKVEIYADSYYFTNPIQAKIVYYCLLSRIPCLEKLAKVLGERWKMKD